MKKSNPFMEFMAIYGYAIISAIIAIGVLAYFGVFNPNSYYELLTFGTKYNTTSHTIFNYTSLGYSEIAYFRIDLRNTSKFIVLECINSTLKINNYSIYCEK